MLKKSTILLVFMALVVASLACNLPTFAGEIDPTAFARSVEETVAAGVGQAAESQNGAAPLAATPDPEQAAGEPDEVEQANPTHTPTPIPTPSAPVVSVSVNTNCRTGPGQAYDLVGGLLVGETAEIVALSSVNNYVVIELPDGTGRDCWLWMQYGSQTGDTTGLPVWTPPPTPTPPPPAISFSMAQHDVQLCAVSEVVFYRVVNNGGVPLESYSITAENLDTAESISAQSNLIPGFAGCIVQVMNEPFEVGDTGYVRAAFTPPIAGDTISATITMCTEDGLGGDCTSRSLNVTLPSVSDVNAKENFAAVDNEQILERLLTLPITSWTYIDQAHQGRHIGPMAQDFNPLFGVGEYENRIQVVDTYGVAFAAIQALAARNEAQVEQLTDLQAQNGLLLARIEKLEQGQAVMQRAGLLVAAMALSAVMVLMARRRRAFARLQTDEERI